MLTVVVVLPTPPFWFATTNTRVFTGRSKCVIALARCISDTC